MADGRSALIDVLVGLLPADGAVLGLDVPELAAKIDPSRLAEDEAAASPPFAALVVGGTEDELPLLAPRLRDRLAPHALVALLFAVPQSGWRAAAARALSFGAKPGRRP